MAALALSVGAVFADDELIDVTSQVVTVPYTNSVLLFKDTSLANVRGFKAKSFVAFGSYNFQSFDLDTVYDFAPSVPQNTYTNNGFYFVESGDGWLTLQVQTKADQGYNGALLGCLFVDLTQVGADIYGEVSGMKYLYGSNYGVDGRKKTSSNSTRYYTDQEAMNTGHAVFNFSLQNFVVSVLDDSRTNEVRVVTVLDMYDNVVKTIQLMPGELDATSQMPAAEEMAVEGYVFIGWDRLTDDIRKDRIIRPEYHRICTVSFCGGLFGDTVITNEFIEATKGATAPDASEVPPVDGYVFYGWDSDYSVISSDTTVNALYHKLHTVQFRGGLGGMIVITNETVEATKAAVAPADDAVTAVDGYRFYAWDADFSCITNNMVISALYHRLCQVKFMARGGSVYQIVGNVEEFSTMSAENVPEAPEIPGYRFTGWNPDFTKTAVEADPEGFAVSSPEYARYYAVYFLDGDGSCISTQYVNSGEAAVAPSMAGRKFGSRVFFGWDKDFSCVTADLSVKAVYHMLGYTPTEPEVVLPYDGTEQILFRNMKISKVIGVQMDVFFRYSTGVYKYQDVFSSIDPPLSEGEHRGSGFYDYQAGEDEIVFEFRGIDGVSSNNGLASAFKLKLWQDGADIKGKLIWFKGGCDSNKFISYESWDNVKLTYDFGFHLNSDSDNYTAKIHAFSLITLLGDPATKVIMR